MKKIIFSIIGVATVLAGCAPSTTYIAQTQGEAVARAKETPEETAVRQAQMYASYAENVNNPCMNYSGDKRDLCNFCTKMRKNGDLHDMVRIKGQTYSCGSVDLYPDVAHLDVPDNCDDFNVQALPILSKFDDMAKTFNDIDAEALKSVTDAQCKTWGVAELDNFVAFGLNINDMVPWQKSTLERMVELCSENGERKETVFTQLPRIRKTIEEQQEVNWDTPIRECDMSGSSCRLSTSDKIKKVAEACYAVSPAAIKARQDAQIARIDREYGTLLRVQKWACTNEYPFATNAQCDCYAKGMIELAKEMIRKPAKNEIQAASQQAAGERRVETKCKLNKF